jgi:hypothetical protein
MENPIPKGFIEDFLLSSDADSRVSAMLNQLRRSGGAWLCLAFSILLLFVSPPKELWQLVVAGFVLFVILHFASTQLKAIRRFMAKREEECDKASAACVKFYHYCRKKGIDQVESPEWKEMVQAVHDFKIGLGKF